MTLRGAQLETTNTTYEDIEALLAHGANIARFQIAPYPTESVPNWQHQVEIHTARLIDFANHFQGRIQFIADLHQVPSAATDTEIQKVWTYIISNTHNLPAVRFYGLCNEPRGGARKVNRRMEMMITHARRFTNKILLVTVLNGDPPNFARAKNFKGQNLWWEVHMYLPLGLTHQGLGEYPVGPTYPTARLDKDALREKLAPVRKFQVETGRRIIVGEFSCSAFADLNSRVNYIRDCIAIFEQYNWRWVYHAWREAPVWNAEASPQVLEVLKKGWAKNG